MIQNLSYLHANVIDIMGTTTTTINIKGGLIKTHVEFIKKKVVFYGWKISF
jgi:hypothetical protein